MAVSRREFLKISGATAAGFALGSLGFDFSPIEAYAQPLKIKYAKETTNICGYCAVGCGVIVHSTLGGKVINTEGDPDHPINQGALCSKCSALFQIENSERRLRRVLYRAPYSHRWEEKSWDWALERITRNIKKTRDATFKTTENGLTVNRTEAIATLGGAVLDNEECYLYSKLARSLGIVYMEHQARV